MSRCTPEYITDIKCTPDLNIRNSSDISEDNASKIVPDSVYQFLRWILSESDSNETFSLKRDLSINKDLHYKILSFGQDFVWQLSGGESTHRSILD